MIDFINPLDFAGSEKLAAPALIAAGRTAHLKNRLVKRGVTAVYANDNYGRWRSDFRDIMALCQSRGDSSAEIAELLAPSAHDLVILKPRQSAFFGTPLDMMLTQMHAKTLVLCGLAANICLQLSAMDAHLRGYGLWIPKDCTAAESPVQKAAALDYMAQTLDADVRESMRRANCLSTRIVRAADEIAGASQLRQARPRHSRYTSAAKASCLAIEPQPPRRFHGSDQRSAAGGESRAHDLPHRTSPRVPGLQALKG